MRTPIPNARLRRRARALRVRPNDELAVRFVVGRLLRPVRSAEYVRLVSKLSGLSLVRWRS